MIEKVRWESYVLYVSFGQSYGIVCNRLLTIYRRSDILPVACCYVDSMIRSHWATEFIGSLDVESQLLNFLRLLRDHPAGLT